MPEGLPPKVVEVYRSVGKIMSRYSAGKVPKAFKIIPNLKNWEEVSPPSAQAACPPAYQLHVQIGCFVINRVRTGATGLPRHRLLCVCPEGSLLWDARTPSACKDTYSGD